MAFPTISTKTDTSIATDETTHTVAYPSSLVTGNLLVGIASCYSGANVNPTWAAGDGWTEIASDWQGSCFTAIAVAEVDGGEGANTSFVTDFARESQSAILQISGQSPWTYNVSAVANSTGTSADPAIVSTPSGEPADDYLFIAVGFTASTGGDYNGYPTNYSDNQFADRSSASGTNAKLAYATRELTAASDDPSAFTISSSSTWVAYTIIIMQTGGTPGSLLLSGVGT